ncbi:MAG: hypothetical protein AAGF24_10870 [Cyanobacteria bacterium P01_H01_bin.121]
MTVTETSNGKWLVASGAIAEIAVGSIHIDPRRFQYKQLPKRNGSTTSLNGVATWNENFSGIVQVWLDPDDQLTYLINGHNRLELAQQTSINTIAVRYVTANTATEARAIGALTNIAESKGNAIDAAQFFKDSGLNLPELQHLGLSLNEKLMRQGFYLAQLQPALYERVVTGNIPVERGAIIGELLPEPEDQLAIAKLLDERSRYTTNDELKELAHLVTSAAKTSVTQQTLFGETETPINLAPERAKITANLQKRFKREVSVLELATKPWAIAILEDAGNHIQIEASKQAVH